MNGFYIKKSSLVKFSKQIQSQFLDEVIPLRDKQPLPKDCPNCHGDQNVGFENTVYWETDSGSHGWCCQTCGMVVQWG
jgi:hypothetical protein